MAYGIWAMGYRIPRIGSRFAHAQLRKINDLRRMAWVKVHRQHMQSLEYDPEQSMCVVSYLIIIA